MELNEIIEFWRTHISRDLTPFVDPGSKLVLLQDGRSFLAQWRARGQERKAEFQLSEDQVTVVFQGVKLSYKAFFAAPEMADLLGLAKMILNTSQESRVFVPTRAVRSDAAEPEPESAVTLLQEVLSAESASGATRIIMVTGEAGAGKTRVLEELVRQQAQFYREGQSEILYLYVNAQGRALARFNEALATELQDLRSAFTYHAVSTLVRTGTLVPIIDGFDELLGVGGYEDAFSSLALFIEELNGYGQIVASARSTYYEQEFLSRANRVSSLGAQYWAQVPIEVLSWGDEEFSLYVAAYAQQKGMNADDVERFKSAVANVFTGKNNQFRSKPLFVARTVDLVASGTEISSEADLLDQLIAAFLERERREKLLSRSGEPLLTSEQISVLLTTLAEEMWNQQTRELDRLSVREITEYVLVTNGLGEAEQRVVIERMPTAAFLMSGENVGSITFEHEMFFSYFLASAFASSLHGGPGTLSLLLGRSVLPTEVARITSRVLTAEIRKEGPQSLLQKLSAAGRKESARSGQVRENAGLIAGTVLHQSVASGLLLEDLELSCMTFPGGDLNHVEMRRSKFENVQFRRVDMSRTRLLECETKNCYFFEVLVSPEVTRLEITGLDPSTDIAGLRVAEGNTIKLVYDPVELRRVLQKTGTFPEHEDLHANLRSIDEHMMTLVEWLMRAYNRSNPVCTADDNLFRLFRDPMWQQLEEALVDTKVVSREQRGTGGPPKDFLRRQFLPDQIMTGANRLADVPDPIRDFWQYLEEHFPSS
jgi:hypothetical protein